MTDKVCRGWGFFVPFLFKSVSSPWKQFLVYCLQNNEPTELFFESSYITC